VKRGLEEQTVAKSSGLSNPASLIAVTSGEPAGIGPDICLALAGQPFAARVVVLGDRGLLESRARQLGQGVRLRDIGAVEVPNSLACLHVPLVSPAQAGKLDRRNGPYVIALLDRAIVGCKAGEFAAMVTAPVHKGVINDSGTQFVGHTEYLAEHTGTGDVVMMLAGGGLRVALATTHLALKDVPRALSREGLERTVRILCAGLARRFGIAAPRVLVAGLNPHSGEGGYFGREEIEVIGPVLEKLRAEGLHLTGPLPADTLFTPALLEQADCVLAMYHDQGLPVLKYASFGKGINVTLGLPFIRTSVDHGTALELAGTGRADPGSLIAAVEAAIDMAKSEVRSTH
jgi:4-hydroxythreonine-4-phosphate dehydrogenase